MLKTFHALININAQIHAARLVNLFVKKKIAI